MAQITVSLLRLGSKERKVQIVVHLLENGRIWTFYTKHNKNILKGFLFKFLHDLIKVHRIAHCILCGGKVYMGKCTHAKYPGQPWEKRVCNRDAMGNKPDQISKRDERGLIAFILVIYLPPQNK